MAPVPFSDIAKNANDLLNRDFYHAAAATLEVKLKAPDGLAITTKGVSPHGDKDISGAIEAKKVIQKGMQFGAALMLPIKVPSSTLFPLEIWTTFATYPPKFSRQRGSKHGGGDGHRSRRKRVDVDQPSVPASPSQNSSSSPVSKPMEPLVASIPSPILDQAQVSSNAPLIYPETSSISPPVVYIVSPLPIAGTFRARLRCPHLGITATSTWTNANVITAKVELDDILAAGVKAEYIGTFAPKTGLKAQKGNLYFKQGAFHARAFGEYTPATGNVNATVDGVVAHEGFLVGGEAGFDVQKAALTRYAAAFGYQTPVYSAAITATNSLSIFAASYYHRVNPAVEAGVKAAYDTKSNQTVGIEVATKYKIDPTAFAKFKLNDRGIVSLAYNAKINSGFTFGIGASVDAQKLNEAGHKIGTSFVFEG